MLSNQELVQFVVRAHSGQNRKECNIPYVTHCFEVAKIVYDATLSEKMYRAALCHDIIEDCPDFVEELKNSISEEEYKLVEELTCFPHETKTDYLKSFHTKSNESLLIKMIDRCINIKDFVTSGNKSYALKYLYKGIEIFDACEERELEVDKLIKNQNIIISLKAIFDVF